MIRQSFYLFHEFDGVFECWEHKKLCGCLCVCACLHKQRVSDRDTLSLSLPIKRKIVTFFLTKWKQRESYIFSNYRASTNGRTCNSLNWWNVREHGTCSYYILKTPNLLSGIGAFKDAAKLRPMTRLVSTGSMTPSSQRLWGQNRKIRTIRGPCLHCAIFPNV